jgi:hypothetical protein
MIYKADKFIKDNDIGIERVKNLFAHLLNSEITINEHDLKAELNKDLDCELIDITTNDDNEIDNNETIESLQDNKNIDNQDDNDSVRLSSLELLVLDNGIVNLTSEQLKLSRQLVEVIMMNHKDNKLGKPKTKKYDKAKQLFIYRLSEKIRIIGNDKNIKPAEKQVTVPNENSKQPLPAHNKLIKYLGDFYLYQGFVNNKHLLYNLDSFEYIQVNNLQI